METLVQVPIPLLLCLIFIFVGLFPFSKSDSDSADVYRFKWASHVRNDSAGAIRVVISDLEFGF